MKNEAFIRQNMDISVVIPAYNEEKYLKQCIDSIKQQKSKFNYEIIVVDNNSTDETVKISKELGVRVIKEKEQGVGAARNAGTSIANGKYVLHMDADSRLEPEYFEKLMKYFKEHSEVVCVGGQYVFYDATIIKNVLRKLTFFPFLWFAQVFSNFRIGPMGGCMAFKNAVYKKTEGFNKKLKFGEDSDLCRQLSFFGKIRVNSKLKCYTSSRRFKFNTKLFVLFLQYLKMVFNRRSDYDFPHSSEL